MLNIKKVPQIYQVSYRGEGISTFAAERSLDSGELDHLVQRLLLLTVLAERHNAVQLLVVLTARLTAELVHLILNTHTFG